MLQVQRLDEKELALLDATLAWSLDDFAVAFTAAEMFGEPPVSLTKYNMIYHEYRDAIKDLRAGKL